MFRKKTNKESDDPLSGTMGHLSESQEAIFTEFRSWVQEMYKGLLEQDSFIDDYYFLRFLRARKFDIDLTKKMFANHVEWMEKMQVQTIMKFDFHEKEKVFPHYKRGYHKTDKLGRPIYYERGGHLKVDKVWEHTTEDRMMMQFIQDYEYLLRWYFPACSLEKGERVDTVFTILDCDGFTMSMMTKQVYNLLKLATGITQDNYPEIMGASFIINTPFVFRGVWAIVSKFLDEKTQKKFKMLKSDYHTELFQVVDKENLPSFVGGTSCVEKGDNVLIENIGPWQDYDYDRQTNKVVKKVAILPNAIEPKKDDAQEQEESKKDDAQEEEEQKKD